MTHQYARAEQLLVRAFPIPTVNHDVTTFPLTNGNPYPLVQFSTVHPNIAALSNKGKGREMPEPVPQSKSGIRLPVGPSSMVNAAVEYQNGASRLVDMSVACRYLAALCQVRSLFSACIMCPKKNLRYGKGSGITQQKCSENRTRFGIQVRRVLRVLDSIESSYTDKSGPAVPNVDGGIKVGTFDLVAISALLHRLRLKHQCAT